MRCQARRHTRPVPRLFSQWYGLVHNNLPTTKNKKQRPRCHTPVSYLIPLWQLCCVPSIEIVPTRVAEGFMMPNRQSSSIALVLSCGHTFYWSLTYCCLLSGICSDTGSPMTLANALRRRAARKHFSEKEEGESQLPCDGEEGGGQWSGRRRRSSDGQCRGRRLRHASSLGVGSRYEDRRPRRRWGFHCCWRSRRSRRRKNKWDYCYWRSSRRRSRQIEMLEENIHSRGNSGLHGVKFGVEFARLLDENLVNGCSDRSLQLLKLLFRKSYWSHGVAASIDVHHSGYP